MTARTVVKLFNDRIRDEHNKTFLRNFHIKAYYILPLYNSIALLKHNILLAIKSKISLVIILYYFLRDFLLESWI